MMATVTLPAHNIDDDFQVALTTAGVTIVDRSNEPYDVKFEGPRASLESLIREYWGGEPLDIQNMIDCIKDDVPGSAQTPASRP